MHRADQSRAQAESVSEALPFLEFELQRQLVLKLKVAPTLQTLPKSQLQPFNIEGPLPV